MNLWKVFFDLESGKFSLTWKTAKVTPIFKSRSRSLLENYRPISVQTIFLKLLEKAAQQSLKDYFENENLFKNQYGFRKKHSTKTASIYFCDSIGKQMKNEKLASAVYVDLSKAFDTTGHSVLLQKLSNYGVKDRELEWFNSYLFNRRNYVCANRNICFSHFYFLFNVMFYALWLFEMYFPFFYLRVRTSVDSSLFTCIYLHKTETFILWKYSLI